MATYGKGVLDGIKVISFTRAAAGSACSKALTDFGAETWLVEPLKGHPVRNLHYNEMYHANMKSVPINLRDPKGMELMHRMLAEADVFVSNYRPQALKNMKLDYESLCEKYPRLIHATVCGYGEKGDMAADPGFDITAYWARAGLIHDLMEEGSEPIIVPSGVGDIECGKSLAMGVIAALFERTKTDKGQKVTATLYGEGVYANHSAILDQQYGVKFPKTRRDPGRALKNSFRCKDGWIQTMTLNWEKDFPNFLHIVGRDDLIGNPKWKCMADTEGENAIELTQIFDEGFAKITVAEAMAMIKEADMAGSPYYPGLFSTTDPQAAANGLFEDTTDKDGKPLRVPRFPVQLSNHQDFAPSHTPALGEDSRAILKQFGYSEEEIEQMVKGGVVVSDK